ncbi:Aldo/keto reductase [Laetiporus sulphureus 93-53]|uniref:Aldo/keto reductase n=1 Tax=Laetiporus sulphureus 93-53 TaxID=1314785 RepID=A0A165DFL6_9APHY|nr:Aldo/keto reductase [Laetiporus sulphureus 93-53]KZT04789.1 Aldo/keto reductase [Laetiporus sulphureus 93-53]
MGCWMGSPGGGERVEVMCKSALKYGYRHLDTAYGYGNEEHVGKAIRESGVPREEIFLTTKLPNKHHHRVRESFEESLKALDCGYIDLYLMHWPQTDTETGEHVPYGEEPTFIETWKEIEKLLATGKVKSIGVSNFSIKTLNDLLPHCSVVPVTNQVEIHPCLPSFELQKFCEDKGILLTAYSPLGRPIPGQDKPVLFNDPGVVGIAERLGALPAQVLISWCVQREIIVIPKSESVERMKANITLVELTEEDMAVLGEIYKRPGMQKSLLAYHNYTDDGLVFGWTYEQLGWNMKKGGICVD